MKKKLFSFVNTEKLLKINKNCLLDLNEVPDVPI